MTLHLTFHAITLWLFAGAVVSFVLGLLFMFIMGSRLEIGAIIFPAYGTVIAAILLILAIGSML